MDEKSRLINIISANGGDEDGVLDFLEEYELINTQQAKVEQLKEYIEKKGWTDELPE